MEVKRISDCIIPLESLMLAYGGENHCQQKSTWRQSHPQDAQNPPQMEDWLWPYHIPNTLAMSICVETAPEDSWHVNIKRYQTRSLAAIHNQNSSRQISLSITHNIKTAKISMQPSFLSNPNGSYNQSCTSGKVHISRRFMLISHELIDMPICTF